MKYILVYIILFTVAVRGQDTTKLISKKAELDKIKKEILELEKELKQKTQSEKKSVRMIENLNKQSLLLNKEIAGLKEEEKKREGNISKTEKEVSSLTGEINSLRKSYAKYLVYMYKYGKNFELSSLATSNSFNQALIKYKYFNRISDQKEKDVKKLVDSKTKLDLLRSGLIKENEEKKIITDQKLKEEDQLHSKLSDKKEVLKGLKNDKAALNEEIELKKKASTEIKNMITQLIIQERKRNEELKRKKELEEKQRLIAERNKLKEESSQNTLPVNNPKEISSKIIEPKTLETKTIEAASTETALIRKGSLLWPVEKGSVFKKFGETKNPKLNTVTINTGIDIKAGSNLDVKSVADGTVSVINWVPGYGSVLIITHKNGFRSVYGHLSEINVSEGENVQAGTVLGKIGESLEGNILHFELWIERNNQNPEVWLARK